MDYKVDLRDIKFQLFEWLPTAKLIENEKFADVEGVDTCVNYLNNVDGWNNSPA